MCTHLSLLSKYPMNTNIQGTAAGEGLDAFQICVRHCDLDERSLNIGRVNYYWLQVVYSVYMISSEKRGRSPNINIYNENTVGIHILYITYSAFILSGVYLQY